MPRDEDKKSDTTLIFYCFLMISSAILNSLTYKKMLNAFKSQDSDHPHNYEFFVNQVNVAMYYLVALIIVQTKAANNPKWYSKQTFYCRRYTFMGFLDGESHSVSARLLEDEHSTTNTSLRFASLRFASLRFARCSLFRLPFLRWGGVRWRGDPVPHESDDDTHNPPPFQDFPQQRLPAAAEHWFRHHRAWRDLLRFALPLLFFFLFLCTVRNDAFRRDCVLHQVSERSFRAKLFFEIFEVWN